MMEHMGHVMLLSTCPPTLRQNWRSIENARTKILNDVDSIISHVKAGEQV